MGAAEVILYRAFRLTLNWSDWQLVIPLDTPQQPSDSNECGPMSCVFIDAILGGTTHLPTPDEFEEVGF